MAAKGAKYRWKEGKILHAAYLWKSFYLTEMFTGRTKTLLAFDWVRTHLFGRDISRY